MKKIINLLILLFLLVGVGISQEKNQLRNVIQFPYDKMVPASWDANTLVFRLMVAPWGEDGNKNYGFTWEKPFKTITGALNFLPVDLLGYEVIIYVHGGFYNKAGVNPNHRFHNGRVNFHWVGTFINNSTNAGNIWVRGGADKSATPILYDSAITVVDTTAAWRGVFNMNCTEDRSGIFIFFNSYDYATSTAYPNMWIFDGSYSAQPYLFYICASSYENTHFYNGTSLVFNLGSILYVGFYTDNGLKTCVGGTITFNGGSGGASTGNSDWGTASHLAFRNLNSFSGTWYYKNVVSSAYIYDANLQASVDLRGFHNLDETDVYANLVAGFNGTVIYEDSTVTLTDGATSPHNIIRYHNNVLLSTTNYFSSPLSTVGRTLTLTGSDSTRTEPSVVDSVYLKININGTDYYLKVIR
jgi:hypothetical protein